MHPDNACNSVVPHPHGVTGAVLWFTCLSARAKYFIAGSRGVKYSSTVMRNSTSAPFTVFTIEK